MMKRLNKPLGSLIDLAGKTCDPKILTLCARQAYHYSFAPELDKNELIKKALIWIERAIEKNPSYENWVLKAQLLERTNFTKAIQAVETAITVGKNTIPDFESSEDFEILQAMVVKGDGC